MATPTISQPHQWVDIRWASSEPGRAGTRDTSPAPGQACLSFRPTTSRRLVRQPALALPLILKRVVGAAFGLVAHHVFNSRNVATASGASSREPLRTRQPARSPLHCPQIDCQPFAVEARGRRRPCPGSWLRPVRPRHETGPFRLFGRRLVAGRGAGRSAGRPGRRVRYMRPTHS